MQMIFNSITHTKLLCKNIMPDETQTKKLKSILLTNILSKSINGFFTVAGRPFKTFLTVDPSPSLITRVKADVDNVKPSYVVLIC